MTQSEKLEALIKKAIDDGWAGTLAENVSSVADEDIELLTEAWRNIYHLEPTSFIFNHDFAKALWGELPMLQFWQEENLYTRGHTTYAKPSFDVRAWQYHLQQMVISEDPIDYMYYHVVFNVEEME